MNTFRIAAFAIAAAIAACSSAPAATLSIADTTVSAVEARDGVMVTLGYQITSDSALTALLGASMTGPASEVVKDDIPAGVSVAVQPGTNWYYRQFRINLPPYASTGASVFYDITYTVRWDASESDSLKRSDILKMLPPVPVRVPILMYHKIGDALYSQYWNTTDMLRAQLTALKAYGYTALTCQELMDIRAGLAPAPAKPILLTFDGGYQNFWLDAVSAGLQEAVGGPVVGASNTGLLVRVWGRVVTLDPEVGEMVIEDGSGALRCVFESPVAPGPSWSHVLLTGVSSCYRTDDGLKAQLLVSSAAQGL